jgi:hypothetical protein
MLDWPPQRITSPKATLAMVALLLAPFVALMAALLAAGELTTAIQPPASSALVLTTSTIIAPWSIPAALVVVAQIERAF